MSTAGPPGGASAALDAALHAVSRQQFADGTGPAVKVSRATRAFVGFRVALEGVALGGIATYCFAAVAVSGASHVTHLVSAAVEAIIAIRYARQALHASVD